ncbi:hypothetical protein L218DRAFT_947446 [Marasmius fiardii PR-910]|nr:hypothetical protein L218DRAFT_947446 [Marasmius fiardii PR-910]
MLLIILKFLHCQLLLLWTIHGTNRPTILLAPDQESRMSEAKWLHQDYTAKCLCHQLYMSLNSGLNNQCMKEIQVSNDECLNEWGGMGLKPRSVPGDGKACINAQPPHRPPGNYHKENF